MHLKESNSLPRILCLSYFKDEYSEIPDFREKKELEDEEIRLGSKSPLKTILILSIGPIISQIFSSLFGVFNSLWVTKTIGNAGLEVFGAIYIVDYLQIGFAQYMMVSVDIRISYLYGRKLKGKCAQLYVDFIRLALLFGILTAAIILPITRPLTEWFGADKELSRLCFEYMLPSSCFSYINYMYMVGCGVLQAEGRPFLFCLAQISTFILNVAVFDPLLLVAFKTPIWGATAATALAQLLVGLTLNICILNGKFGFQPELKMFISKFSKETGKALIVGIPELVMEFSLSVPLIMMQKYIENAAAEIGVYDEVTEAWALTQRLYAFVEALMIGFIFGMLPAASYAYGAKRYNRVMKLALHTLWLATVISSVVAYFIVIFVRPVSSIWYSDSHFLDVAEKIVPVIFYAIPLIGISYMTPGLLEALQRAISATILSVLSLLLTPMAVSSILHFTDTKDPYRVMLTYPISDAIGAVLYVIFLISPMKMLCKAPPDILDTNNRAPVLPKSDSGINSINPNSDIVPPSILVGE